MIRNFFDIMGDILLKKNGSLHEQSNFKQVFSPYMLNRYLSMSDELVVYTEFLNKNINVLTSEQIYLWAWNNIPKQKSGFIKYIKKKKKN